MQGHLCWDDHHPTEACVCSAQRQPLTFLLAGLGVWKVRKFAHLLGAEGTPLPQRVCLAACKMVRLLKAERNLEKPSGFRAVIFFTAAVLKTGVTSPERQNWAD